MQIRPPLLQAESAGALYPDFARPVDAYRPIPWWAWTGSLGDAEIRSQLDEMKAKGVYEFFLFPVYGLEPAYMSAEYWERVGLTLRECRARGMKCWIYDEYNWPSGVCAGRVLRDHPEFAARTLHLLVKALASGESLSLPVAPDELAGCYALDPEGRRHELAPEAVDEGSRVANGSGEAQTVCAFWVRPTVVRHVYQNGCLWNARVDGYTDLLSPDAVRAFLDSTYAAYRERYPDAYPDVVPGYFTDEPGMAFSGPVGDAEAIPYTPGLFEAFRREYGYDLREVIHRMAVPEGDFRSVRRDFWGWCARRFRDAYTGQLAGWCEAHGLAMTGHFLGEEAVSIHVGRAGDLFEAAGALQIPGIDLLENVDGYSHDLTGGFYRSMVRSQFHLTAKWMHGIVRHSGRREMMSEAFGVCDWGLNPSRQRKGTNYQAALGVTLFNDNSLISSISDFRKTAIGGKHFTVPWWQHYRHYSDYCARVAGLHAEGRPWARIAILYPRTALWTESDAAFVCRWTFADPEHRHPAIRVQEALADLCDALLRRHHPFDIVPEPVAERAEVADGHLRTPAEQYRVLILPGAIALPPEVVERALALVRQGGSAIFVGDLPERVSDTWEMSAGLRELLSLAGDERQETRDQGARGDGAAPAPTCGGVYVLGHPPQTEGFEDALDGILRRVAPPPVTLVGPGSRDFISSRRLYGDDAFTFVANMADEERDLEIRLAGARNVEVWHPDGGERYRPEVRREGNEASFGWHFAGGEGVFVVDAAEAGTDELPALPFHRLPVRREVLLDGEWGLALEPGNLLRLELDLRRDPENVGWRDGWHRDTGSEGWEESKQRRVAAPIDLRETAWYWIRARLHVGGSGMSAEACRGIRLVADDRHTLECYVNGVEARGLGAFTLWDQENRAFEVGPLLREGENVITLRVRTSPLMDARVTSFPGVLNLLQPVVLVGDFAVAEAGRPQAITPPVTAVRPEQSLHLAGFPHFAGVAVYGKRVFLDDVHGPVTLDFPATRDSVEVWVNGGQVAVRPWPPYTAEVSRFLRPGENRIELRVHTPFGNLLKETYGGRAHEEPFDTGICAPPALHWRE